MFDNSVFHVGMPRTSTTWHQNQLFPVMKNVNFCGRRGMSNVYDPSSARQQSVDSRALHDLFWTYLNRANLREWEGFKKKCGKILDENKNNILSQELVLFPEFGNVSLEERIRRISEILPKIRIYITIRRQIDYLKSVHSTSLKGLGNPMSQKQYIEMFALPLQIGFQGVLDYEYIISLFRDRGHECHIIPYELILDDKAEFLSRVNNFFKQHIKVSEIDFEPKHASDLLDESKLRSIININNRHFFGSGLGSVPIAESILHLVDKDSATFKKWLNEIEISGAVWNSVKIDIKIRENLAQSFRKTFAQNDWESPPELDARIMSLYRESNEKLDRVFGLDLKKYGYY